MKRFTIVMLVMVVFVGNVFGSDDPNSVKDARKTITSISRYQPQIMAMSATSGAEVNAAGTPIVIRDFQHMFELLGGNPDIGSRHLNMGIGEHLWIQKLDGTLVSAGLNGVAVHVGFVNHVLVNRDGSTIQETFVDGYGKNQWKDYAGYEGRIYGAYYRYLETDPDKRPDDIWIVLDVNDDGIGTINGSGWQLGADDLFYTMKSLMIGEDEIRGAIEFFPAWPDPQNNFKFPRTVLKPQTDMDDLITLAESWLRDDASSDNYGHNGADLNRDGNVNLEDFAELSSRWLCEL